MNVFKEDLPEAFEEFDFYHRPEAKVALLKLRSNLNALPLNERLYEMENYAFRKGLIKYDLVHFERTYKENLEKYLAKLGWTLDGIHEVRDGNKRPMEDCRSFVFPGYGRFFEAYKWLRKLEESDTIVPLKESMISKELPF